MGELTITYNVPASKLKTGVVILSQGKYFGGLARRGGEQWVVLAHSIMDGEQIVIMARNYDGHVELPMLDKVMLWEITKEEYDKREESWQ